MSTLYRKWSANGLLNGCFVSQAKRRRRRSGHKAPLRERERSGAISSVVAQLEPAIHTLSSCARDLIILRDYTAVVRVFFFIREKDCELIISAPVMMYAIGTSLLLVALVIGSGEYYYFFFFYRGVYIYITYVYRRGSEREREVFSRNAHRVHKASHSSSSGVKVYVDDFCAVRLDKIDIIIHNGCNNIIS